MNQAALKKQKEYELCRVWQRDAGCRLAKEGARQQEEYNCEQRALEPVLTPLLIPWDGASMSG